MDATAISQAKTVESTGSSSTKSIESVLPAGKNISAKITQITPDPSANNAFRVKLDINNNSIQVSVKFTGDIPDKGSQVNIQRSESGKIQLQLNTQAASTNSKSINPLLNTSTTAVNNNAPQTSTITNNNPAFTQGSNSSIILKAPVVINTSDSNLANIEKALPKGETVSAKVIIQNGVVSATNTAIATTVNNSLTQIINTAVQVTSNTTNQIVSTPNQPTTAAQKNINTASNTTINNATSIINNTSQQIQTQAQQNTAQTPAPSTASPTINTSTQGNIITHSAPSNPSNLTLNSQVQPPQVTNQSTPNNLSTGQITPTSVNTNIQSTTLASSPIAPTIQSSIAGNQQALTGTPLRANQTASNVSNPINTSNLQNVANSPSGQINNSMGTTTNNVTTNNSVTPNSITTNNPTTLSNTAVLNNTNGALLATSTQTSSPQTNTTNTTATQSSAAQQHSTQASSLLTTTNQTPTSSASSTPLPSNITSQTGQIPSTTSQPNHILSRPLNPFLASTSQTTQPTAATPSTGANVVSPQQTTNTSSQVLNNTSNTVSPQQTINTSTPTNIITTMQPAITQTANYSTSQPTQSPAPQNAQLQGLNQQATAIKIEVAGQTISLKAPANLPFVQNIQITRSEGVQANIQWQQAVVPTTNPASNFNLSDKQLQLVESNLRQVLPQQIPIAEGINQLISQTSQIANTSVTAVPIDKIALSIMQLFGVKPGASNSSDTIKRNIQQGGLFTENRMASQANSQQGDMKSFLAQLSKLADNLPTEQRELIQNTADRMLARVTTNQLTHVQQQHAKADISNERTFQIDLPVQSNEKLDNVEMEIKQRKHTNEDGQQTSIWSVKLHFDLEENGEVDAEVALNPIDNSISTTFLCTHTETLHKLESRMNSFRQDLHQQGFEVQTLHCSQGSQMAAANNSINKRIIDIRT